MKSGRNLSGFFIFVLIKVWVFSENTHKIMAFEIKFYGSKLSETDTVELSVWVNGNNEITINVNDNIDNFISLDKPTAVRLVRELKRQISEIE